MLPDWILVANGAEARLLQRAPGEPLCQLQVFHRTAGRSHRSERREDRRGAERRDGRAGAIAYAARLHPYRWQYLRFAREVAGHLEEGVQQVRFGSLRIFAAKPFLEELRAQLGDGTRGCLAGAYDLDLSGASLAVIEGVAQLSPASLA